MFRRALADLRPYLWSVVALLLISLTAVPITLITPLPIKLLVDSVLGSLPLAGYLGVLSPVGTVLSKNSILWLTIGILI